MADFFGNYPLVAALVSVLSAQIIKLPLNLFFNKKFDPWIMFSTGGMPSSHSAFVSSLAIAIAIQYGVASPYFAIAAVFALITMWDAAGVRYQASKHAKTLNELMIDFRQLSEYIKYKAQKDHSDDDVEYSPLKELLGHKPFEVVVGSVFGIVVALIVSYFYV